ncbi:MAG: calcium-binding protein [Cyanobacteriota bacterium]|nr:calcium-binding protein [Cyanobacteriota bacterium]
MKETYFLSPSGSVSNSNFASAQGGLLTENYSHPGSLSNLEDAADIVLKNGIARAIADAQSIFSEDDAFTALFSDTGIVVEAESGSFDGKAKSKAKVTAAFEVGANETFSFETIADLFLEAKEIENPDAEFSRVRSGSSFLLVDVTDEDNSEIIDYAVVSGRLISSQKIGRARVGSTRNVSITQRQVDRDVNGNNGTDSVSAFVTARYERQFDRDTRLALIQTDTSTTKVIEDPLIDRLGSGVTYGSINKDRLEGNHRSNKIYASLGNDRLFGNGGDDILEAGSGNDRAVGGRGDDKINGGRGNDNLLGGLGNDEILGGEDDDTLTGGRGSDTMTGGRDDDTFAFIRNRSLRSGELDTITDFQPGLDTIEFRGWGRLNANAWFDNALADDRFIDTSQGALFKSNYGGEVLFEGIDVSDLSASDFSFV